MTAPTSSATPGAPPPPRHGRQGGRGRSRASLPSRVVLLLVVWLATAACYGKGKNAPAPVERTTVKVENRGFLDRDIFVVRSGQRIRLGTVTGGQTATFTIPASIVSGVTAIRFIADPIGAPRPPVTEEITVSPGDQVVLTIPPS